MDVRNCSFDLLGVSLLSANCECSGCKKATAALRRSLGIKRERQPPTREQKEARRLFHV
jgi:hypothetical protein